MTDRYHDAAIAYKNANPVPNPDDLQLIGLDDLSTLQPVDLFRTSGQTRAERTLPSSPRMAPAIAAAALVLVIAGLAAFFATSSDESPPATEVTVPSTVTTIPAEGLQSVWDEIAAWASGSTGPGEFRSLHFEPALRFSIPEGWVTAGEGANTRAAVRPIVWAGDGGTSAIYIYSHDFLDSTVVASPPTPQELVDWIKANESVVNLEESTTEIGGLPATRLGFSLSRNMLYIRTRGVDGPNLIHDFDQPNELVIYVLDVDGHTVSLVVEAEPPADVVSLDEQAQAVLESIAWRHLEE